MYDHELILLGSGYTEDELGNQIPSESRKPILCKVDSIGRNEFYSAASSDLRPEIVFTIHKYEYDNERKVEFEGQQFSVLRTYAIGFEELELTCERVGADVQ
ncbi:phage head closure protein [Sporosarcina newyorkensis]|uniref:phage head closure protein n=1 Tax=Sporosarcina newyorkensis TaxID=759851 RepID=UPI003D027FCB